MGGLQTIDDLLDACAAWFDRTGQEITFVYVLLAGVNDQPEHAHALVDVVRRLRGSVNLLRWNEVEGCHFNGRPMTQSSVSKCSEAEQHQRHHPKKSGRDIAAACGQLKHESKHDLIQSRIKPGERFVVVTQRA